VDLGKLIEEILPWLVIAGMYVPWLRKKMRKQRRRTSAAGSAVHRPSASAVAVQKTESVVRQPVTVPGMAVNVPEEGVHAVMAQAPMKAVSRKPRNFSPRRRELRKALLLGEILARKY